jgi:hypothetical protein
VQWAQDNIHLALEIVKRPFGTKGFVVIRGLRVVERTPDQVRGRIFAWIMTRRRLVRD